ncbi:lipopolysaccharide biosynthesis protein [Vibrio tapetis]|uniref:Putative Polysaccharide biosynthesis protein n=1 Tax=Vibrio tapetis subsp. tapetis TaxID=1671868 RepID=A0A2N8ZLL2_9VIBR|nr:polysaccharide biosynthesis C-terminal domain-containing protein [Vibrio tapetis]SON52788.1 putative Polysaccharide biosynthesis protein [Vibrio tapetis subsp. tapetis]
MLAKLFNGALLNILNILIQLVLGLYLFREMLIYFGAQDFGLWSMMMAMLAHIALFEFGLGGLISRVVSQSNDLDGVSQKSVVTTCYVMICSVSALFFISSVLGASLYTSSNQALSFEMKDNSLFYVCLLLSLNFTLNFISGAIQAFLIAKFHMRFINAVRLMTNIMRMIAVLTSIHYELSLEMIAVIFVCSALFELLCRAIYSYENGIRELLSLESLSKKAAIYISHRASRYFFMQMAFYVRNNSAVLFSGALLGPSAAVTWRIVGRLMEIYVEITSSINYLLTPYFSRFIHQRQQEVILKFKVSLLVTSSISALILFNIFQHSEWFLGVWLGEYPPITIESLQLLAIGFCLVNMQGPCTSMLIAKDKYQIMSYISIGELVLTLVLMPILMNLYGNIGAAYALLCAHTVIWAMYVPWIMAKQLSLSLSSYYLCLAAPTLLVWLVFQAFDLCSNWLLSATHVPYIVNFIALEITLVVAVLVIAYRVLVSSTQEMRQIES